MLGLPSPSTRSLLALLRRPADPARVQQVLRRNPDWEQVLAAATSHGVSSLLYTALRSPGGRCPIATGVMERLEAQYYAQAALNVSLHGELERVLSAFTEEQIPVIVLKGAALAEEVYGNIALRSMQDLDLLARWRDLDAADSLMRVLGYLPDDSYRSLEWYRNQHHHLAPYGSKDGRTVVEIHHHIVPPAASVRVPIEELWTRARRARVASVRALVFSPEDQLLHQCLDISCVDRFARKLRALYDIVAITDRYRSKIDWPQVVAAARAYRASRAVYYPLCLAQHVAGAEVPDGVLRDLRTSADCPPLLDLLLRSITRHAMLVSPSPAGEVPAWILARTCRDLLEARGTWGAIKATRPLDLAGRALRHLALIGRRSSAS